MLFGEVLLIAAGKYTITCNDDTAWYSPLPCSCFMDVCSKAATVYNREVQGCYPWHGVSMGIVSGWWLIVGGCWMVDSS